MIHWDVSPEILRLGPLALRWYGLCFALAFLTGFFIVQWMYQRELKPEKDLDRLLFFMLGGTLLGARLGHCFFYEPAFYLSHPLQILMFWRGGLASHGALVGIVLSLFFYSRTRPEQPYGWLVDRIVVPAALAGFFIRLGNLFNSEIIGTPTEVPWAFVFARIDSVPRHPAQLYESIAYVLIFGVLLTVYRKYGERTPRGLLTGLFLLLVFSARFMIEFVKVRQAAFGEALPLSMGQFLSIPLILVGLVIVLRRREG